ncbi:MAG: alpha/beta hydrolase [Myxococcaceae bacterium]|nr:alpha/beta hydrolase [Myxococcaceae bacterium]
MIPTDLRHTASDGKALFVRRLLPRATPRAAMLVVHGLAEHSARYVRVAEALTTKHVAVYALDLRGHGQTAGPDALGFFDGGLGRVVQDLEELIAFVKREHAGLPFVLFGHSMGSFFAQELMIGRGAELDAVVLSGSTGKPNALAVVGQYLARFERWRLGERGRSALLKALGFDGFNKPFKASGPTNFEWLSRDRAEVDKYVADPLCGFEASTQLWTELLELLTGIAQPERQARIPKSLPVYVFAGADDPASDRTKSLTQLLGAYRAAGLSDVTHRFYEGARHEALNETNREQVTADLLAWLEARVPGLSSPA